MSQASVTIKPAHWMNESGLAAIIAAGKVQQARLSELRAQRPFRVIERASNIVPISAARKSRNVLLQGSV